MNPIYIYPDNLKAAPTLGLWRLQDLAIGGLLAVLGVMVLVYLNSFSLAAIAALFLFLTIRFDDVCILDFIRKAVVYYIFCPQSYFWGSNSSEVKHHQKKRFVQKKKEAKR